MNIWDVVVFAAVAGVVGLAVWRMVRNRKKGKGGCSCGCGSCTQNCAYRK